MGPPSVLSPKHNFSILLQGLLTVTWWMKFWNGPQIIVMFSLSILLNFLHHLWTLTSQKGLHTLRKRQLQGGHPGAWQNPLHVGAQVDPVGKPSRVLASWPWPLPTMHWWKLLLLSQCKARRVKVKALRGGLGKESKEEESDCLYWLKDLENSVHLTAKKDQNDTPHSYI